MEPPVCSGSFSTEAGGFLYSWRGWGPEKKATAVQVYDPLTEQWTSGQTTGTVPPGLCNGGCTSIGNDLYCFGGYDGSSQFNELHKLNLESLQWSLVHESSEFPMCKAGCSLVAVDEGTLACFGGYGSGPTQPGSTFTRDSQSTKGYGWTNELYLFNLKKGIWSSRQMKGERPPPCSVFSFTKIDQHRAVLFGGYQPDNGRVNELYIFNFNGDIVEVTKVEPVPGEPCPVGRSTHAACCFNQCEEHPKLLISGGVDKDKKMLGDMWILDVDHCKWTELSCPESVLPRCRHSITAICLGSRLTEVIIFGGRLELGGSPIALTTILRFECLKLVTGPLTEKWALVDVAHNNTRGSRLRLRDKRKKMKQACCLPSTGSNQSLLDAFHSSQDQVRDLEQQLQAAKQRTQDAEQRERVAQQHCKASEKRERDAQHRCEFLRKEANHRCQEAERQLAECEKRLREAQQASQETEQRAMEAERRSQKLGAENSELHKGIQTVEGRAQLAEQRADKLETRWVIHRREIQVTDKELGKGKEDVVKVAMFRGTEVAAKILCEKIQTDHLFVRDMSMAAQLHHPHVVQFIGATWEGEIIILTELMHTSLRGVLEQGGISREHTISISVQVCQALNYLHQIQPDPVIHHDISSANVLLNPLPNNGWLAKVTDFGSVSILRALQTENAVYAAPEASQPSLHSTKMDIFSLGVLMIEICTGQLPNDGIYEQLLLTIPDHGLSDLISRCIDCERDNRPTAEELLGELKQL